MIVTPDPDHLAVSSVVVLHDCRKQEVHSFAARCEHHLRQTNGTFEIAYKKVTLVSYDQVQPNINYVW